MRVRAEWVASSGRGGGWKIVYGWNWYHKRIHHTMAQRAHGVSNG